MRRQNIAVVCLLFCVFVLIREIHRELLSNPFEYHYPIIDISFDYPVQPVSQFPHLLNSSIFWKSKSSGRLMSYEDLSKIPQKEWKKINMSLTYTLYPQNVDMDAVIENITSIEPLSVVSFFVWNNIFLLIIPKPKKASSPFRNIRPAVKSYIFSIEHFI